jgi:ABC-2 type transport system permease protein
MRAIYGKELKSYFFTPVGWLFMSVFLGLASLIFYLNNILPRSSDFTPFLSMMSYVWMLLSPMLVMRLLAGERRLTTDKLLYSAPLSVLQIVAGKYLAACTVLLFSVIISFLYPALLSLYAPLYLPEILTAYLGFVLQGCAFIALDLAVTAPTKSSATAAAVAFGANLFVWLISLLSTSATLPQGLGSAIGFLSLYDRFVPFLSAQLSPANILFYLLFCLSMLALTVSFQKSGRMRRS